MHKRYGLNQQLAAIITGASSGIGKVLAIELAKRYQARLVLNARNEKLLDETRKLVIAAGGRAEIVVGDIANEIVSHKLADTCLSAYGQIDLLVNNAGFAIPGPLPELTMADWRQVFDVNFFGALATTYAVLPTLMAQKHGKIVNIASVAGKIAFPGSVCYSATKFALTGASEGMAAELAANNIDVITVCPGLVRTEFFENNKTTADNDPTKLAQKHSFVGWLTRNIISVSTEQAVADIINACQKGGAQEIVITIPGIVIDHIKRWLPTVAFAIAKRMPPTRHRKLKNSVE